MEISDHTADIPEFIGIFLTIDLQECLCYDTFKRRSEIATPIWIGGETAGDLQLCP